MSVEITKTKRKSAKRNETKQCKTKRNNAKRNETKKTSKQKEYNFI